MKIELEYDEVNAIEKVIWLQLKRCNKNPLLFERDYEKERLKRILSKLSMTAQEEWENDYDN